MRLLFLICLMFYHTKSQDFLISSNGSVIFEQHIAADSLGNFVVVWDDSRNIKAEKEKGIDGDVYGRRFNNQGLPIVDSFRISDDTLDTSISYAGQYWPKVAMNANGEFVVVWTDSRPQGTPLDNTQLLEFNIYAQLYDRNGLAKGNNFLVNDTATTGQINPDVIIRNDGSFIVTWLNTLDHKGGVQSSFRINLQCFDPNGSKIGSNKKLDLFARHPRLALFDNGNFIITADTNAQIFSFPYTEQRYPFKISDGNDRKVKISKDNIIYIVSTKSHIGLGNYIDTDIYIEAYNLFGAEIVAEFKVNDDNTFTWQRKSTLSISDNNIIVAWEDYRNGYEETGDSYCKDIYAQRFDLNLTRIGPNIKLSHENNESRQFSPSVILKRNKIYLTWIDDRNKNEHPDLFPPISKWDIWATIQDFENPVEGRRIKCQPPMTQNPSAFIFFQSMPNPTNSETTLIYDLPEDAIVNLQLYNSLGKEVKTLVDRFQTANRYYYLFYHNKLSNGIYFARLTARTLSNREFDEVIKIIVIR